MLANHATVEELRWKKFPVLSDGYVTLVDVMGDDNAVAQAARVSYGNDNPKIECALCKGEGKYRPPEADWNGLTLCEPCSSVGYFNKKGHPWKENDPKADRDLIRRLMRHRHTTPFEMAEVKFLVRVPMDCWRQWIRHRTANVNEYSTRYAEAIDSMDVTKPDEWRLQSDSNRQGSGGFIPENYAHNSQEYRDLKNSGTVLSASEGAFHHEALRVYEQALEAGVAREQARKNLPLCTYTEAYWKIDLHNLLGFLALRMDGHAQKEIRDYATIIGEQIVKPLFPVVWEAFEDYRLHGMFLTRLELEAIKAITSGHFDSLEKDIQPKEWQGLEKCRERDECVAKLIKMGLLSE